MKTFRGNCHCKDVAFTIECHAEVDIIKCNCSICFPLDFVHLIIPHKNFKLLTNNSCLKEYVFETKSASHYFCKNCGIKSFYQPRSHPDCYSINYRSLHKPPKIRKTINFNGKFFEKGLEELNKIT